MTDVSRAEWELPSQYDFFETTRFLRTGRGDPTVRREEGGLWRTANTADGPATVHFIVTDRIIAEAWGPGASAALADVPQWIGLQEDPWVFPPHEVVDRLMKEHGGIRGTDTCDVFEGLVNVVLQQQVTWNEAAANWRRLCESIGEPAPGPMGSKVDSPALRLSPTPRAIRAAGLDRLRALGIGGKRARTLIEVARVAHAVGKVRAMPTDEASRFLQHIPGVGPWTAALTLGARCARPEPILVGDYHLSNTISWALAGEPRGTERRMLELLEPFAGQAYRVTRLILGANLRAPRRGPRRAWRGS